MQPITNLIFGRLLRPLFLACILGAPGLTVSGASTWETLFEFGKDNPPGNIAASADGRIFMSLHQMHGSQYKVVEVLEDGSTRPYPTAEMAEAMNAVLGINIDDASTLWMLETASGSDRAGRLIGWNIEEERLERIVYLALPTIPADSFLNDFAVDTRRNAVYIADTAAGYNSALIVVDLDTGGARRVLEGSEFTIPEDIDTVIDGRVITLGGAPARIGVNPITIDPAYEWVYFAPMNGTSVYRVRATDLSNAELSERALRSKVERYGDKPISDGITVDSAGNVYITSITDNSVGVTQPDGTYRELFRDDSALSWPDGFAIGRDNKVYATVNQLHRSPVLNDGTDGVVGAFRIIVFDALAEASPGR